MNDELLVAISNMINPIREDMREMRDDIRELKQDFKGLQQEVGGLKQNFKDLQQEVGGLEQDVQEIKTRARKIELTQENEVLPRLNTIESCYISTYDMYRESVENYEVMKQDISVLKRVVEVHSERLQKIG